MLFGEEGELKDLRRDLDLVESWAKKESLESKPVFDGKDKSLVDLLDDISRLKTSLESAKQKETDLDLKWTNAKDVLRNVCSTLSIPSTSYSSEPGRKTLDDKLKRVSEAHSNWYNYLAFLPRLTISLPDSSESPIFPLLEIDPVPQAIVSHLEMLKKAPDSLLPRAIMRLGQEAPGKDSRRVLADGKSLALRLAVTSFRLLERYAEWDFRLQQGGE